MEVLFHVVCIGMMLGGGLLSKGKLSTASGKAGAAIATLGLVLIGMFWTGTLFTVIRAVKVL